MKIAVTLSVFVTVALLTACGEVPDRASSPAEGGSRADDERVYDSGVSAPYEADADLLGYRLDQQGKVLRVVYLQAGGDRLKRVVVRRARETLGVRVVVMRRDPHVLSGLTLCVEIPLNPPAGHDIEVRSARTGSRIDGHPSPPESIVLSRGSCPPAPTS